MVLAEGELMVYGAGTSNDRNDDTPHEDLIVALARYLRPNRYVELGIWKGGTFRKMLKADVCECIGVDIAPVDEDIAPFVKLTDTIAFIATMPVGYAELVFVDADHRSEQVLAEFEALLPKMNPNGIIALHDTFPPAPTAAGPGRCLDSWRVPGLIKAAHPELEVLTLASEYGLTLVRCKPALWCERAFPARGSKPLDRTFWERVGSSSLLGDDAPENVYRTLRLDGVLNSARMNVMEVGVGAEGKSIKALAKLGHRVFAVDLAQAQLRSVAGVAECLIADKLDDGGLGLPPIQLALAHQVIQHCDDDAVVQLLWRVLRWLAPGAPFVVQFVSDLDGDALPRCNEAFKDAPAGRAWLCPRSIDTMAYLADKAGGKFASFWTIPSEAHAALGLGNHAAAIIRRGA